MGSPRDCLRSVSPRQRTYPGSLDHERTQHVSRQPNSGDSFLNRLRRWASGPDFDGLTERMAACLRGPRRKGLLRRFAWWLRSAGKLYRLPDFNENLAVGWFTSAAPSNPLVDGCGFIIHAAEGENGELWARVGKRCLSAFRRLQNLRIYYVIALRERGAVYYAAATAGAHGVAGFPMMRPIAIDPFNADETLYAGIHQCVLGQIGFRVDTRVHGIHIEPMPEFASLVRHGACRRLHDGAWPAFRRLRLRRANGAPCKARWSGARTGAAAVGGCDALALLDPAAPSGLVHALVEAGEEAAEAGLVWRARGEDSYWLLKVSEQSSTLVCVEDGVERQVAIDPVRGLKPRATHSIQVLDDRVGRLAAISMESGFSTPGSRMLRLMARLASASGSAPAGANTRLRGASSRSAHAGQPGLCRALDASWRDLADRGRVHRTAGRARGPRTCAVEAIWEKTLGARHFDRRWCGGVARASDAGRTQSGTHVLHAAVVPIPILPTLRS